MTSTIILYSILYAGALIFVIGCVARAVGYARLPMHLRWELYPVPHEEKHRAAHGGSYFEVKDWWTKPASFNLSGELKSMVPEILFLKGLWEFKRKMWYRSYPFHLGLYLLIGATGLLLSRAFLSIVAPDLWAGAAATILHFVYMIAGVTGITLTLGGAIALLFHRLRDEELRNYTTFGDIFNLSFFIVTLGFLSAGYILRPDKTLGAWDFVRGALTFDTSLHIPVLFGIGLVLGSVLTAYIPMTHMSHFIAKYFTYHSVRWDDKPNWKGGKLEEKIAEYLTYRPDWAAPHVGANGVRTWAEIATSNPAKGGKK